MPAKLAKMDVNTDGVQGEGSSKNTALVESVTKTNIEQAVQDIQSRSSVLAHLVFNDELNVVDSMYDLDTGRVTWKYGVR